MKKLTFIPESLIPFVEELKKNGIEEFGLSFKDYGILRLDITTEKINVKKIYEIGEEKLPARIILEVDEQREKPGQP